jgi:hypothetical protein
MLADAKGIVRAGLRSARGLVTEWRGIVLDGHRLRDGSVKMDSETISDLAPWDHVLVRLDAADRALGIKPPTPDRKTIQRGLRAAMALAKEHREAITNGYGDSHEEPEKHVAECRRYVRPVDRTIAKIQAAMCAANQLPPAPCVSRELRDLIATVDRAQAEHEAASDAHDLALAEVDRLCPWPKFMGKTSRPMAEALAEDSELSDAERAEARSFAGRLEEAEAALNVLALDEVSRVTANAWTEAEAAVLLFPARSLADCLAKLRYGLRVRYYGDADDTVEKLQSLADDLERITGGKRTT